MRLEGKVALVTGAGSGIGRHLAAELAARGARLFLVGRREAPLRETVAMLPPGADAVSCGADLTMAADRAIIRDAVADRYGRLDLLVNNAGVVPVGPLAETDDLRLAQALETNLLAPMALTRELLPLLRRAAPSRVVNVGSMFGDIAYPLFAAYSASKFGLRGLSDALRRELRPLGIGVTYAAPRATRTPAASAFAALVEPFQMRLDAPETVARAVVRGIEREARVVYPRGPERLFVLVQRLFPRLVDRAAAQQLARAGHRPAVTTGAAAARESGG